MSTNYFEYAVVWNCQPLAQNRSREIFWVLSRTPTPSANVTEQYNNVLRTNGVIFEELRITNQTQSFCESNRT